MWLSICKSGNFVSSVPSVYSSLKQIRTAEFDYFFVMNFIIFVLSKFRTNFFFAPKRIKFYIKQKLSKFLLEIMTIVSSSNNSDTAFILRGRSYIRYEQ